MSHLQQLETQLNQDALARQEFHADPVAALGRAGIQLPPDKATALRGLLVKTHLKAGPRPPGIVIELS